jgi:hypothetical protein
MHYFLQVVDRVGIELFPFIVQGPKHKLRGPDGSLVDRFTGFFQQAAAVGMQRSLSDFGQLAQGNI